MELCKVKNVGGHYVAQPYKNISIHDTTYIFNNSLDKIEDLSPGCRRKDLFLNEYSLTNFPYRRGRKPKDEYYEKLRSEALLFFNYFCNKKIKNYKMVELIIENLLYDDELEKKYHLSESRTWLKKYVEKFVESQKRNISARKSKFRRKAMNNDWNYFTTYTYDTAIMYERITKLKWERKKDNTFNRSWGPGLEWYEANKEYVENYFQKKLKKKLQDLYSRNRWLRMGVWERGGKTGRLHYHCFLMIPQGEDIGDYETKKEYNWQRKEYETIYSNTYFEKKFGRNDYKPIGDISSTSFINEIEYMLEYITKQSDKIDYSRGIKEETFCIANFNINKICKLSDNSPYYIMTDDFINKITIITKFRLNAEKEPQYLYS